MCTVCSIKSLAAFRLQGIDLKAAFTAPYDKIRFMCSYDRACRAIDIPPIRHYPGIVYLKLLTAADSTCSRP